VLARNPRRSLCDIPKVGVKISLKKMPVVFFQCRSRYSRGTIRSRDWPLASAVEYPNGVNQKLNRHVQRPDD